MDFEHNSLDQGFDTPDQNDVREPGSYVGEASFSSTVSLQAAGSIPMLQAGTQNTVILPAGVELDDIRVVGRDLVISLPDGSDMVIPDGAVFIPQFVIDGVSVPPLNLAALLVGNEPQPAAGPPQSSGGNFADPVGDIGDPFELGDLLPPTALSFPEFEQDELFPFEPEDEEDELPAAIIVTPDNPTGATNASSSVDESGLPARGSEPEGTNASGNGETTVGSIIFNPGDGPAVVSINGVAITAVGQSFAGNFGTLTITSISNGSIGYTYTLDDNTSGDNTADQFAVSVVDADGDVANADLTISIIDDAPVAVMDTDSIVAGEYGPATGNVITDSEADGGADIQGADGALVAGVAAGDTGTVLVDAGTVGTTVNGLYGVLTLNGDGSYSYARNPDSPGGVQDVFTYTLQDGDGDTSVTTLTIDIADSPVTLTLPVSGDAGAVVDEEGLPARGAESPGSNEASDLETTAGTISYDAADGPATVTINGVAVTAIGQTFAGASGTLTITGIANGAVTYSYTLADNTSGDNISDDFAVVITDQDGDSASGTLTISIIDDAPVAVMDTDSIVAGEYGPATGNVITDSEADGGADIQGADGALVAGVAAGDTGTVLVDAGTVGTTVNGLYGVLTLNGDGSYSYARNPDSPGGVQDVFTYTLQDGDGDTSVTTLTIDIADSPVTLTLPVSGDAGTIVEESGLPNRGAKPEGTNEPADSETTAGTITFDAPDGPGTVTIDGVAVTAVGQTFVGSFGTLTITGITNGAITYSYTLADNSSGDATSDSFAIVVTDIDGDISNGVLTIDIIDDAPIALDDLAITLAEDAPGTVGGNVLANDTQGADGAVVTSVTIGGITTTINPVGTTDVVTANGTYSFTAAGAWTFDPNPNLDQSGGDVDASFTYTITDGDGDIATAEQPISITDGADPLAGAPITLTLDDQNLADGSTPAGPDFVNGNITFTAGSDAISSIVFGTDLSALSGGLTWVRVDSNTITGSDGTNVIVTLSLSVSANVATVTATLNDNYDSHPVFTADDLQALGSVTVVATDSDGDTATGTVNINVSDDVPTAFADVDSVKEDGGLIADGNVLTGIGGADTNGTDGVADVQGADGATVTGLAFGLVAGTLGIALDGAYGKLTLNADGGYSYMLTNNDPAVQGLDDGETLTEIFTYTITDADGDEASTTLAITINGTNDAPQVGASMAAVSEEGLLGGIADGVAAAGSSDTTDAATFTGQIAITDVDGEAQTVTLGDPGAVLTSAGAAVTWSGVGTQTLTGSASGNAVIQISIDNNGNYTITLLGKVDHPGAGFETAGEDQLVFTVPVTSDDGTTSTTNATGLTITIEDDSPSAVADTATVAEGATIGGNVVTDAVTGDAAGADGFASAGAVTGVATGNDTSGAVSGNVGAVVNGTYGKLTISSDGTYSYMSTPGSVPPGGATDTFVYTVTDGDGDTSTTTLTILLNDSGLAASKDDVSVNEAALDTVGSDPASNAETVSGTIADNVTGGTGPYTYTVVGSNVGSNGTLTLNADGSYSYTLTTPVTGVLANDGTNIENNVETFTIEVKDANGNTTTTTITVDIVDDIPSTTGNTAVQLDDDALGGNAGGTGDVDPDTANTTGTLNHVFGADGGTLALLASGTPPTGFTYEISGGDLLIKQGATTVITVTLDSATGAYTVTQNAAIDHAAGLDENDISFTLNYQVTDGDGDIAAGSLQINVDDDTPTVSVVNAPVPLVVDETDFATDASASFAGIFTSSFGADGAGSITYTLGTVAGQSGLVDTATGQNVLLALNGTVVEGRTETGGDLVFTITVAANGTVMLDQVRAVVHGTNPDPNDPATLSADNLVTLTATITDGDGDSVTAIADIGSSFVFRDDGPSIDAAVVDANTVMLVTQDADTVGAASDTAVSTANFGDAFSIAASSYGADGAGSTVWSYALVVNSAVSGLSSDGVAIALTLNGTVVEGRAGADLIFTIATDATSGVVTLTQFAEIDHGLPGDSSGYDAQLATLANGLVSLEGTATITDGDGDTASETVSLDLGGNVKFADDGPSVTATPTAAMLMVDETTLGVDATADLSGAFTVVYGADGAGTTAYTLSISATDADSGLVDVATGEAVLLRVNGNIVEGYSATGGVVFTVSVNASGVVELDQLRAVEHTPDTGVDQSTGLTGTNLITLTATATDGDGDTATGAIDLTGALTFKDDGPSIDAAVDAATAVMLVTQDAETDGDPTDQDIASTTANFGGAFSIASSSYGADGAGTTVWSYALVVDNAASGLTSGGDVINLYLVSGTVVGSTAGDAGSITAGNTIFTIGTDAVTGVVTLTQFSEIDHDTPGVGSDYSLQQAILGDSLVSLEGTATITDRDGDSAFETVSLDLGGNIKFDDDGPSANPGNSTGTVDEDGLAGGIEGGTGDVAGVITNVSGSVTTLFNAGADAPLTYQLLTDTSGLPALTSGGANVTYAVVNNVLTASAGGNVIFTFTLNETSGAWDFVLSGPLDHAIGDNENDIVLSLGSLLQATDFDGDFVAAAGSVVITIDDDTPTATNEASQNVNEGATVSGTLDFMGGADGATVTHVNGAALVFTAGPTEFSDWVDIGDGMIRAKADGSYEFTADNPTLSVVPPTIATFTVTDGDGDTATANISFQILDANVPTAGTSAALVDDDGLAGGNPLSTIDGATDANADGDNNPATFGGILTHNFGGDGAGSINFASMNGMTATIGQETVTYAWSGSTLTATITGGARNGIDLFTVEVTDSATGAYEVTLLDNVLHATGPNEENAVDPVAALAYTVLDADGSSASGTLNISFDDDAPTLSSFSDETVANAAGQVANGTFTYAPGADDHASFNISGPTLDGVTNTVTQNANGALLTATVDGSGEILYTLQVNTDGTYDFTLVTPDAGSTETISLLGLGASGPDGFLEVPAGNVEFTDNETGEGINSSTQGFGIQNQFVGNGQSFTMEFHDPGIVGDEPTASNPNLIDSVALGNNNINGSLTIQWTATNSVSGQTETGVIVVSGTTTLIDPTISFNHLLIEGIGGNGQGVRFSSLDITKQIIPQDLNLPFQVSAVDGDGDVTQLDDFNVFIDASLAPTLAPLAPINFLGVENEPIFMALASDGQPASNDNGGLMLQNINGLGENVALIEPAKAEVTPAAKTMLANSNEAQAARAGVKAPAAAQIALAATLLAANSQPEESTGSRDAPLGEIGNEAALDFGAAENQPQPEAVELDGGQVANEETGPAGQASASGDYSGGSDEASAESAVDGGDEMFAEESSGSNDAQPGFDASEFQSASGLQLDMGIAMNVEALAPVGETPAPVQLDIAAPDTPPATVEEIVADAIDGGSPEIVSIDAVIDAFAGNETEGGRGAIQHLPEQALPEQILDMFVMGDAGPLSPGVSDGLQTHIDMADAGHAAG